MPKGKHAAALFEVINRDKKFNQKVGMSGALRTPKWWFKGREQTAERRTPAQPMAPESTTESRSSGIATPPRVDVVVDPDRQQISFRLTYTSAAIGAFALVVVIVMAYLVGQKLSRGPASAQAAQSTEEVRNGPVLPGVMDVNDAGAGQGGVEPMVVQPTPAGRTQQSPATQQPSTAVPPQQPSTFVAQGGVRQNGLNYVIVQSYPERKDAEEAVELLAKAGIGATIETKLRGMHPEWYTVVGTDGFARLSSPEYNNYITRIEKVSQAAYRNKRSFKAFQPMGYRWDRSR